MILVILKIGLNENFTQFFIIKIINIIFKFILKLIKLIVNKFIITSTCRKYSLTFTLKE